MWRIGFQLPGRRDNDEWLEVHTSGFRLAGLEEATGDGMDVVEMMLLQPGQMPTPLQTLSVVSFVPSPTYIIPQATEAGPQHVLALRFGATVVAVR